MNTIKIRIIMILLSTTASISYAETPAISAPSSNSQLPPPISTAPASVVSVPMAPIVGAALDISGKYQCQGYDPYSKNNYSFPTVVFTKNGDVYNIQWQDANGYPQMIGTGVINPDITNAIAIVYWPIKKEYFIVGIYKQKPGGILQSNWVMESQALVGTETCTKKNK